jgi:glucokinase
MTGQGMSTSRPGSVSPDGDQGLTSAHAAPLCIGVDIGGTKTEAVLLGAGGEVLRELRLPTGHGPEEVVATAVAAIEGVRSAAGDKVVSIGVGIPGMVDPAGGAVSHAINLGVEHLDLGPLLAERFGTAVRVENDVNAAALGAFHLLNQRASASLAYLNLGTGLAAGLVLRGELWRGARGAAGEIGHILVDPAGPLDLDGQRGGLEVVASGSGVARQWGSSADNTVTAVLDAADAGDGHAIEIRRRLFEGVASSVRILVLTVDVDLVVIGGGLARLGERLLGGVHSVIAGWESQSSFIESLDLGARITTLPSEAPVAALGAAHLGSIRG